MRPIQLHLLHFWRPVTGELKAKVPNNPVSVRSFVMVGKQRKSFAREVILPRSQFKKFDNRCFLARLRGSPRKSQLSGHLVQRRTDDAHKSSGIESRSLVFLEISSIFKRSLFSSLVKQHYRCPIPESARRNKISTAMSVYMETFATSNLIAWPLSTDP